MKLQFICVFALVLLCSVNGFAQDKPSWITSVENTIKQKETDWKIERKIERIRDDNYSFTLKSGNYTALIQITAYRIITNPEETFNGLVISFDNTMGKNQKKSKLENFGNEGFIWNNLNQDSWTTIKFRKKNIFVNVFAPSEKTARRFAQYVLEQMPND